MDSVSSTLGLAKKAGRLEVGEEPVGAACRSRRACVILLASDAAANTIRRAAHFGEAGKALWLTVPLTKAELGRAVGRATCAMAALTDIGFAASLAAKLASADPEAYGPAAEQLKGRSEKKNQRCKEQQDHEKNIQKGKKKPRPPIPGK